MLSTIAITILIAILHKIDQQPAYTWSLPVDIPPPKTPKDNPMSDAKVKLGRHLFYDVRLSANQTISCGTCHLQSKGFTDGKILSKGVHGAFTRRNSMSLTNVGYNHTLTWANPLLTQLEHQARIPLFADDPEEMGIGELKQTILKKLQTDPIYQEQFNQVFTQEQQPINFINIIKAIAAFQRTLLSFNSPYDQYLRGESSNFGPSEKRGMAIFFSEQGECFHCHGGFNFTDSSVHEHSPSVPSLFHNNGLYNVDGLGGYPARDRGLYEMTASPQDMGKFKAPTLRNIAVTAPYMHDGSFESLEQVIHHYIAGGSNIHSGKNKGFGAISPIKSEFVSGLNLSPQQTTDLLNFLNSLTDQSFLTNPSLSDPWLEK